MKNKMRILVISSFLMILTGCSLSTNNVKKNDSANAKNTTYVSSNKAALQKNDFIIETSLHDAVRANDMELVKSLLSQGIKINSTDKYGYTPLHLAVRLHNYNMTKYLIEKGANVNTTDVYEDTPLLDSTRNNDTDISKVLICNGANRNVSDRNNMSTLHNSSKNKNLYITKLLRADNLKQECGQVIQVKKQEVVNEPEMIQPELNVDIDKITNNNRPLVCGNIIKGDIKRVNVVFEDTNKALFGPYNADIDSENKTWCAQVEDTLKKDDYTVVANGFDNDNNKATDTATTQILPFDTLYEALMNEFQDDFGPWNASLDKDTLTFKFKKPEYLFQKGSGNLATKFKNILDDFFPRYVKIVSKYKQEIQNINIEGHTSSEYSTGKSVEEKYNLNQLLSDKRASGVLDYLKNEDQTNINENSQWINDTFVPKGLSSSKLIRNADGTENQEESRRVEFNIITKSSDITLN